jgi:hypothetical protein
LSLSAARLVGQDRGIARKSSVRLRHPKASDLSLAGVRLVIADHATGLPVLRALSLCTCRRQYPGVAAGRNLRSTRPVISAFLDMAVGSAYASSFSRLAQRSLALRACTLVLSPIRDTLIEGFSHFVISMTAPLASGWSGCRVGLTPTEKRRLSTAHVISRHRRPRKLIKLMRRT